MMWSTYKTQKIHQRILTANDHGYKINTHFDATSPLRKKLGEKVPFTTAPRKIKIPLLK